MMSENKRPIEGVEYQLDRVHYEPIYDNLDRYTDSYRNEVDHFIRVLRGESLVSRCTLLDTIMQNKLCIRKYTFLIIY